MAKHTRNMIGQLSIRDLARSLVAYAGDNPILIAVWADWAHLWDVATSRIVEQLGQEFAGRCEFAYVEATSRAVRDANSVQVVPALILRHHGSDIMRFVNVLKSDEVRSAIAAAVAEGPMHTISP